MTRPPEHPWTIDGAEGEPILGCVQHPGGEPAGAVVIAHGFKGYLDYGMFPVIASALVGAGFIVHRFNFSHSGMTRDIETFARPELFERDTGNKQVFDLHAVCTAIDRGEIAGAGAPRVLFGHSRGGATTLLAAGRLAGRSGWTAPAGIVTAAAPSGLCRLDDDLRATLMDQGFLESPSSRTGQVLRIGKAYLQEQRDDPTGHDLMALVGRITCPLLIVHGADDPTVPARCASDIEAAATAPVRTVIIDGANHVFNTPNPMAEDAAISPELRGLLDEMVAFTQVCCAGAAV
jgi:pimeloyl-ACP methyl ester carboxylesterase